MPLGKTSLRSLLVLGLLVTACGPSSAGTSVPSASSGGSALPPAGPASAVPSTPTAVQPTAAVLPSTPPTAGAPSPAASPTATPAASPATGEGLATVTVQLEPFATGLASPLFVTSAGDGSGTLYVVEQGGTIRTFAADGTPSARPFLDISARVTSGGERGLLGLAFHPEYRESGRLFVDYTDLNGDTVVSEFLRGPDGTADPATERPLLKVDQPFPNHNGGMLAFGPDGNLYIGLGDGGSAGDPQGNGQDRNALLGKILRISVDGVADVPYAIPAGAPFAAGGGRPEIWDFGLRNPWRFSFDRATGDLYIADVGQGSWEEVDLHPAGAAGGLDFGWNAMEGPDCYEAASCERDGRTLPVAAYSHAAGCSISGGYVYRGSASPALAGIYLYSDYCSGTVWGIASGDARRGPAQARVLIESGYAVSSFGEDEAGELYLVSLGGAVYRLTGR